MATPVKIVGRFATSEDAARALGVPPGRRKQLEKLADELLAKHQPRRVRISTGRDYLKSV